MFWADFFSSFFFYIFVLVYMDWWLAILKTEPDQMVRPVLPGMGANPVRLKPPKPINNRSKTGKPVKNEAKTKVEPEIKKKKRFDIRFGF